jgi:hypothetical protein
MTTYINNRLRQPPPPAAGNSPQQAAAEGSDLILWAAAQNQAISKLQILTTMAKQVNDQQ